MPSCLRAFLLEPLERRLCFTGDTGQVLVFPDGPIDFATGQFKAPVEKTIGNLGEYDANGNLVGSNNGLLTGKRGSTEIISFDEQSGVPSPFDTLPHVPELNSPTNDFRVDYTGASSGDPRAALLQSAQAQFYYAIDDYRTRILTDAFIDSLNMPAQLAQNLKHLQYRPDLVSNPAPTLQKPVLQVLEATNVAGQLYDPIANTYDGAHTRTRANVQGFASLAPITYSFDAASIVADYVGLATNYNVGFNQLWTADFNNWQNNILAAVSDGLSSWATYRYTGNPEIHSDILYALRAWAGYPSGGSNAPAEKGTTVRNVQMFDASVSSADMVFPFTVAPVGGVPFGRGPIISDWAGLYIAAILYDIANEVGLGMEKTDRLAWKAVSLFTSASTFTGADFGNELLEAARALWPKPGNPAQGIYEADLINVLASRGLAVNGATNFRNLLPTAIGDASTLEVQSVNGFGSAHPESQGSVPGSYTRFENAYTDPDATASYVAYQFYKHSKYGPGDVLAITSKNGSFSKNPVSPFDWSYNGDGDFYYEMTDREPGNAVVFLPGHDARWMRSRKRTPNDAVGHYAEDVRPFGFRVVKAMPNGFSYRAQALSETATHKSYRLTIVDPSQTFLGAATYDWNVSDRLGNSSTGSGGTFDFTVLRDEPITISITRTRGATVDTLTLDERSNDLARDGGSAFARDLVTGSIWGKAFIDNNGNGVHEGTEPAKPNVTVYLDADNDGIFDAGEVSDVTNPEGYCFFGGLEAGTYHVRQVLPEGFVVSAGTGVHDVTLTGGNPNQSGFNFGYFPSSILGQFGDDAVQNLASNFTITIQDKPGDPTRVQITQGVGVIYEVSKAALGNHLTLHLSAGNDIVNSSATGLTLSITSAGGTKTLNISAGTVTLDTEPESEDAVKTANTPVNLIVNLSGTGALITRPDANQDHFVNALDFNALATNFGASGAVFRQGDFNYDGLVTTLDFSALAASFNTVAPTSVPGDFSASLSPSPLPRAASVASLFSDSPMDGELEKVLA